MVLTFCNNIIFIDYKMTNTNVRLLNISSFNYFKTSYAQKEIKFCGGHKSPKSNRQHWLYNDKKWINFSALDFFIIDSP